MPKTWTLVAHPGYFQSLRANVTNPDERYLLSVAIWDRLQKTDDPTVGSTLVGSTLNRYTIELRGYLVHFELPQDRPDNIDLIGIRPSKM